MSEEKEAPTLEPPVDDTDVTPPLAPPAAAAEDSGDEPRTDNTLPVLPSRSTPPVPHVMVIDFHPIQGNKLEFCYPTLPGEEMCLPAHWKSLPFVALPDGSHRTPSDYVFFTLPREKVEDADGKTRDVGLMYGVSCFRQMKSADLPAGALSSLPHVRSTVQKAVVALFSDPFFGYVRSKVDAVTCAYFEQKDFEHTDVLQFLHSTLNRFSFRQLDESQLFADLSPRRIVHTFRHDALALFKLLLIEPKMLVFSQSCSLASTTVLSLASLVPGLLMALDADADTPTPYREDTFQAVRRLKYGLPLRIFASPECPLLPFVSLKDVDRIFSAHVRGYVAGTSSGWFVRPNNQAWMDCVADVDTGKLLNLQGKMLRAASLTAPDRKFIDDILKVVDARWRDDTQDNDDMGTAWEGSDEWIRLRFQGYLESFLATMSSLPHLAIFPLRSEGSGKSTSELEPLVDFNLEWVRLWLGTRNGSEWMKKRDSKMAEGRPIGHPLEHVEFFWGDMSSYVTSQVRYYEPTLNPIKDRIGDVVSKTAQGITSRITKGLGAMGGMIERISERAQGDATDETVEISPVEEGETKKEGWGVRLGGWGTSVISSVKSYAVKTADAASRTAVQVRDGWQAGGLSQAQQTPGESGLPRIVEEAHPDETIPPPSPPHPPHPPHPSETPEDLLASEFNGFTMEEITGGGEERSSDPPPADDDDDDWLK